MIVSVNIDGTIFARGDAALIGCKVRRIRGKKKASSVQLELADPHGELFAAFPTPERGQVIPVTVRAGETPSVLTEIFGGDVASMGWSWAPGRLSLHAVDKSRRARRARRTRVTSRASLGDLAREVAAAASLELDLTAADPRSLTAYGALLQHAESDWDVLERLAGALGHDAFVISDTLYIARVWTGGGEQGTLPVIRSDSPELSSLSVQISEPLPSTTARLLDVDGTPAGEVNGVSVDRLASRRRVGLDLGAETNPGDLAEGERLAMRSSARVVKQVSASVNLEVLRTDITVREPVVLSGFGERVDGPWRVERVDLDCGRLDTKLELLRIRA